MAGCLAGLVPPFVVDALELDRLPFRLPLSCFIVPLRSSFLPAQRRNELYVMGGAVQRERWAFPAWGIDLPCLAAATVTASKCVAFAGTLANLCCDGLEREEVGTAVIGRS